MKSIHDMTTTELYDEEAMVASKLNTNPAARDYLRSIHKEMKRRSR